MLARARELAGIALLATVLTAILAWPVLRAPAARVFGVPLVGVHHDPFTMMQVWEGPVTPGVAFQPVTDLPGHWLASAVGPVAAYNWMVLVTFPLTAVTAFALARQLKIARSGATLAALACAFSPFHLAHAAYHPHIAQVQWIPLYMLALCHVLVRTTAASVLGLTLATAGVVWSNFYAGWIVAALTPVVMLTGWSAAPGARKRWLCAAGLLACAGVAAAVTVIVVAPAWWSTRTGFAVSPAEVAAYSARPIAYLIPPAAHPWVGAAVTRFWHEAGVGAGLLEQQVSLGWGIVVLATVATVAWGRRASVTVAAPLAAVPALLIVGAAAAVLSASPALVTGSGLHALTPMFRSYARFGVVTHLSAVLLAGIGLSVLRRSVRPAARVLGLASVVLVAAEYVVVPSAASREILPTAAHRWVRDHPTGLRVLDCMPFSAATASDIWLTRGRVQLLGGSFPDCAEPHLAGKLAALGFTHMLVRAEAIDARWYGTGELPAAPGAGLSLIVRDSQASLWRVSASQPAIYVDTMAGLLPRERDDSRSWRWMAGDAQWSIMNPGPTAVRATLSLELSAFSRPRVVVVTLNGTAVRHVLVSPERQVHVIGPLLVPRGHHALTFSSINADPLSVAFGGWRWTTTPEVR